MAISDDFTLDYVAKTITHTAGTTIYSVNALYSWLMDLFDDAAQMDDDIPMSAQTPTQYSFINDWTMPDASYQYLSGAAITDNKNNALWANVYSIGDLAAGSQVYIVQNSAEIPLTWGTGHIDVLVKIKDAGVFIDSVNNGLLLVAVRDMGNTFTHVKVDCSDGVPKPVSLETVNDKNNNTPSATIATYNDISITFGTVLKDLGNGNGAVSYDVVVDCATRPLSEVYEYLKYVTRHNSATTLNGDAGEEYLAANTGYTEVKAAPFGTYAGGTFFGARGVWLENYDASDAKNFQLIDATDTTQTPPNTIAIKVTGVAVGDRVLVGQLDGVGGALTGTDYIDETATATTAQTTMIYSADIPVLVRVRKKGILPFEVESTITSTGMSVAAIRTTDAIVG